MTIYKRLSNNGTVKTIEGDLSGLLKNVLSVSTSTLFPSERGGALAIWQSQLTVKRPFDVTPGQLTEHPV